MTFIHSTHAHCVIAVCKIGRKKRPLGCDCILPLDCFIVAVKMVKYTDLGLVNTKDLFAKVRITMLIIQL